MLALLGIVLGPANVSAAVRAVTLPADMQQNAMPGMTGHDDMSCCPDEQPGQKGDCGSSCPLALVCFSVKLACQSDVPWSVRRTARPVLHGLLKDIQRPSALVEPPTHPPKA
ncbi:hypothetical protein [Rhizobium sp. ARZ01]|uniref:hypothetical protein n=1 Tax=Rhizobium sp. ARZ01 TaxID=2769313 RepID=UPI001FEF226D|nr:hypothetical protein [Rhizobium sp. ARZ01]